MNSKKMTIKDSTLSFLGGFFISQLFVVMASMIALVFFNIFKIDSNLFDGFMNSAIGYLISSSALYVGIVLVFIYFNKNKNNKIFKKVKALKVIMYICIAILSFLTLYPIITCIDSLLMKWGITISTIPFELTTKNYFIALLPMVIAPAICEELLFRGIIFKGLKSHGKVISITLSSLMFSIFHMSLSQTVYPLLMGLLLSVIMFYEDNIYYSMTVHLVNNFMALTLSYFKINLIFNHWTYMLLAIILLIVFLIVILTLTIKNYKNQTKQPLSKQDKIYLFISLGIMILFWILANFI